MEPLSNLIQIQKGVTAFVGGGGKTSAIYELAKELCDKGERVIVTTTTKMYVPKSTQVQTLLLNPTSREMEEALKTWNCIGIGGGILQDKITSVTDEAINQMKNLADYVLVEADGSKHMPIKVPNNLEPVIPKSADQVVAVLGISGLGQPIKTCCFRQEEVMALLEVDETHKLEIQDIIKIILSSRGLRKSVNDRRFVVLFNQMDTLQDESVSKCIVEQVIKHKIDAIIFASLQKKQWWCENI